MMASLTVLHAPNHGPTVSASILRKAFQMDADSIGFTEAYRKIRWISLHPNWRTVYGVGKDTRRGGKDNPVAVRKKYRSLGEIAVMGCDASTPVKIAPERWINVALYYKTGFGRVAHISLHPNAKIVGVSTSTDRVKKYIQQMQKVEGLIKLLQNWDYYIVVTGDMNYPFKSGSMQYSPQKVFGRCKLDFWVHGIDYVAYSAYLEPSKRKTIPARQLGPGQDHPWMLAVLEKK